MSSKLSRNNSFLKSTQKTCSSPGITRLIWRQIERQDDLAKSPENKVAAVSEKTKDACKLSKSTQRPKTTVRAVQHDASSMNQISTMEGQGLQAMQDKLTAELHASFACRLGSECCLPSNRVAGSAPAYRIDSISCTNRWES